MEVLTEVPETGTKLKIDADRQFDGGPGDSTLRIQGQTREGAPTHDATYVEVAGDEATLVAWLLRAIRQPTPELHEKVTQEVQAAFSSRLSGRDAHQVAELAWKGWCEMAGEKMDPTRMEFIAERFERAAGRSHTRTSTGARS